MISFLNESKTLVILDAGHGVTTPGKRSPIWSDGSQLMEYEFNRKITHYIYEFLKAAGISCIVITNDDTDIPLKNRVSSINSLYDSNKSKYFVYAVSIHGNAADNVPSANGIEVYTTKGITKSDSIAEQFVIELSKLGWNIRADFSDGDKDKEEDFYILKNTTCPSILTENGFYTNREECRKMLDDYWRKKIALAHVDAIQAIENKHKKNI